jgi:hypothetical protein
MARVPLRLPSAPPGHSPSFSLRQLIENWTQIATQLADSPRERKTQEQKFKAIKAKTS